MIPIVLADWDRWVRCAVIVVWDESQQKFFFATNSIGQILGWGDNHSIIRVVACRVATTRSDGTSSVVCLQLWP